jgi:hypothetical protein
MPSSDYIDNFDNIIENNQSTKHSNTKSEIHNEINSNDILSNDDTRIKKHHQIDSVNSKLYVSINIIKNIVIVFKKILTIIHNFQNMIDKLGYNNFNINNKNDGIKNIMMQTVETTYNNILFLLSQKYNNQQIINYTTDCEINNGYLLSYFDFDLGKNIEIAFINSFKIQFSPNGIIKIVEYNKHSKAISIFFIGTHFNKISYECDIYNRLTKAYNNNLNAIAQLKIICFKYIQIYNNIANFMQ